jgi:quercetin dioxygenase-like cupin family protein
MNSFEQLNVYGFANLQSKAAQQVHLFAHEELQATLLVLPPGTDLDWHQHEDSDELLDVVEGEGSIGIGDREFRGGPGKSVYVKAGVVHRLKNDSETFWLVRSTSRERLYPRHFGKLLKRAIRARLKMD